MGGEWVVPSRDAPEDEGIEEERGLGGEKVG